MSMDSQQSAKVSIVLPTFNQGHYLLEAIQSILNQTYSNFELIVVNDGSTDETSHILSSILHPRLKIITQENKGLPAALNTGFESAQGEYWTWTSTDNAVSANWLEELVKALDNSPKEVGYAFSYYAAIDDTHKVLFVNRDQRFDIPTLLMRHTGNASFLYRAELAKKVGPYDTNLMYAEDLDMWIRMAEHTRAVQVETILYYYRIHNQSMTQQQLKVCDATKRVVQKYLAKHDGKFDIDKLFPSIKFSADPAAERWKARIWLVTIGACATFYCPVDALVEQLVMAMQENYQSGLVGNIVHLYIKEERWDDAARIVDLFRHKVTSDFLIQLADIIARRSKEDLQKIPFLTIDEKLVSTDCNGQYTQFQLLRNLAPMPLNESGEKIVTLENFVIDLVTQLEDERDHPEVWMKIASLRELDDRTGLHKLTLYISELTKIPQDTKILTLLKILEAVCIAYTGNIESAINKLKVIAIQCPSSMVLNGALLHISQSIAYATL